MHNTDRLIDIIPKFNGQVRFINQFLLLLILFYRVN